MAEWLFEPGHTAAGFCARHMMVTCVRGHFKGVHGKLIFDPARPEQSRVEAQIDARSIWTGNLTGTRTCAAPTSSMWSIIPPSPTRATRCRSWAHTTIS